MMVTCGLEHLRQPEGGILHGHLPYTPARVTAYGEDWTADPPVLFCEGEVTQFRVGGELLRLYRRIEAPVGGTTLTVRDRSEGEHGPRAAEGGADVPCLPNFGFPAIAEGSRLLLDGTELLRLDFADPRGVTNHRATGTPSTCVCWKPALSAACSALRCPACRCGGTCSRASACSVSSPARCSPGRTPSRSHRGIAGFLDRPRLPDDAVKITDVVCHVLEAALAEPFAYSQAWYERRGAMLVEVVARTAPAGWGEAFGPPRLTAAIVAVLPPAADRRRRARDRGDLADAVQRAARPRAEGPADRGAQRRRHRAVGPQGPRPRPAGAPADRRPAAHARAGLCHRLLSQARRRPDAVPAGGGARPRRRRVCAIKLKLGFGLDDGHPPVPRGAAREVGTRHRASWWTPTTPTTPPRRSAWGGAIEELDIAWFEEPVPPEDLDGYREVKAALTIPVAGGEAEFTRWGYARLIAERLVDILQPDICAAGRHLRNQEDRRHGQRFRRAGQSACLGHRRGAWRPRCN